MTARHHDYGLDRWMVIALLIIFVGALVVANAWGTSKVETHLHETPSTTIRSGR